MSWSAWPSLSSFSQSRQAIVFERGIFGKVPGLRSDYRWIGRTSGFQGHRWDIHRRLSIGLEDDPRKALLWYVDRENSRCYAAFCYPSMARDATGRSGFLEKQILECGLKDYPGIALAAFVLLRQAASRDSSEWSAQAADPRWAESDFCLPLKKEQGEVTRNEIEGFVDAGLEDLKRVSPEALQEFYTSFQRRHGGASAIHSAASKSSAFLEFEGSLAPEGLAALLLPFQNGQLANLSLVSGLPVRSIDAAQLGPWSGVVCRPGQVRDLPSHPTNDEQAILAKVVAGALREKSYPRTAPLLDFAVSEDRWRDRLTVPSPWPAITDFEIQVVRQAVEIVRRQIDANPGFTDKDLLSARQRHLETKIAVIMALALDSFRISAEPVRDSDLDSLRDKVLDIWGR